MASRRDQLHSYQFMIQRVVAALVMRETDPAQSPFRRAAGAIFAGIMVGAIVLAGFAVYGLWDPGGNLRWKTWSDQNEGQPVIVVEEETGAIYVYQRHKLHPVENIASAMLMGNVDQKTGKPYYVSRDSLAGVDGVSIGVRLGIPDAPDSLPSQENLIGGDWSLCSQPRRTTSGDVTQETVMVVGGRPAPFVPLADDQLLLVEEAETSIKYLIYHSHRFEIVDTDLVLPAFGLDGHSPLQVGAAWLSALTPGQQVKPLEISGYGGSSSVRADAEIGQLFRARSTGQHYVALADRFAVITEFQARLLSAANNVEPTELDESELTGGSISQELMPRQLEPGLEPPPDSADLASMLASPEPEQATCAIFGAYGGKPPRLGYGGSLADYTGGVITELRGDQGTRLASRVVVPPGQGALVWTSENPSDRTAAVLGLVTHTGRFYALSSRDVVTKLGYDLRKARPGWMPTSLVGRLRAGPTLDPQAAWHAVPESG